jgi:hypothetical protein
VAWRQMHEDSQEDSKKQSKEKEDGRTYGQRDELPRLSSKHLPVLHIVLGGHLVLLFLATILSSSAFGRVSHSPDFLLLVCERQNRCEGVRLHLSPEQRRRRGVGLVLEGRDGWRGRCRGRRTGGWRSVAGEVLEERFGEGGDVMWIEVEDRELRHPTWRKASAGEREGDSEGDATTDSLLGSRVRRVRRRSDERLRADPRPSSPRSRWQRGSDRLLD